MNPKASPDADDVIIIRSTGNRARNFKARRKHCPAKLWSLYTFVGRHTSFTRKVMFVFHHKTIQALHNRPEHSSSASIILLRNNSDQRDLLSTSRGQISSQSTRNVIFLRLRKLCSTSPVHQRYSVHDVGNAKRTWETRHWPGHWYASYTDNKSYSL